MEDVNVECFGRKQTTLLMQHMFILKTFFFHLEYHSTSICLSIFHFCITQSCNTLLQSMAIYNATIILKLHHQYFLY